MVRARRVRAFPKNDNDEILQAYRSEILKEWGAYRDNLVQKCKTHSLFKNYIVDGIVAAHNRFTGDRDALPIRVCCFAAHQDDGEALRERLSRLTLEELVDEKIVCEHVFREHDLSLPRIAGAPLLYERLIREQAKERALRERQAEFAGRPRLQPAILDAARYYRGLNMIAKAAWRVIERKPHKATGGKTVIIKDSKMRVLSAEGKETRPGITFGQWRKRYWPAAHNRVHSAG